MNLDYLKIYLGPVIYQFYMIKLQFEGGNGDIIVLYCPDICVFMAFSPTAAR